LARRHDDYLGISPGYFEISANSNIHAHPENCKSSPIWSYLSDSVSGCSCCVLSQTRRTAGRVSGRAVTLMLCSHCSVHASMSPALSPSIRPSVQQPANCTCTHADTYIGATHVLRGRARPHEQLSINQESCTCILNFGYIE